MLVMTLKRGVHGGPGGGPLIVTRSPQLARCSSKINNSE